VHLIDAEELMGAWATGAYSNDGAAHWFDQMFVSTGLATYVEKTLRLDAAERHQEVRAAAYVMVCLGRGYIWPANLLEEHLTLAISKLQEIKTMYQEKGWQEGAEEVSNEIAVLSSHRHDGDLQ
jgi:hypothetical protein